MLEALLSLREFLADIFGPFFSFIKITSATLSLVFFFGTVYSVYRLFELMGVKVELPVSDLIEGKSPRRAVRAWKRVEERLAVGDDPHLKLAVIEADKVLDEVLKLSGFPGESMGDRLKSVNSAQLSNLNDIWHAHKLRNRIVHEPDYDITKVEADVAVKIYARALEELGLL